LKIILGALKFYFQAPMDKLQDILCRKGSRL